MELNIQLTKADLMEYYMSRLYASTSGLIGTVIGCWLFLLFAKGAGIGFLIAAVLLVAVFPVQCRIRVQKLAKQLQLPRSQHMTLDEQGITVCAEAAQPSLLPWQEVTQAFSTRRSIAVTSKNAGPVLFPRRQLQEQLGDLTEMLSTHLPPDKVRIRGAL